MVDKFRLINVGCVHMTQTSGKITSIKQVKEKLAEKNFAPRKSLGQNFLIDENILQKIVTAGEIGIQDVVLEIGPGLGALTEKLVQTAGKVVAVEYDRGLTVILSEIFAKVSNLVLINQDILTVDLKTVLNFDSNLTRHFKVMANLPYYITTPVIFKLIETDLPWQTMVFLIQKEVADRLNAKPGTKEYGALTVMLHFFGRVERVAVVPKTVFYPAPQVDSTIVKFVPKPDRDQHLLPYLRKVVQAAFGQRRKTILNALLSLECFDKRKESTLICLQKLRIDPQRRGETLTLPEFLDLAAEVAEF